MATESNTPIAPKRMHPEDSEPQISARNDSSSRASYGRDGRVAEPKRVACVHCRQSKLRCDSPRKPCSRCERLGLECRQDTKYRRVNKRSKIDELEDQVHQLRAVLAPPPTQLGAQLDTPAPSPTQAAAISLASLPSQSLDFSAAKSSGLRGVIYSPLAAPRPPEPVQSPHVPHPPQVPTSMQNEPRTNASHIERPQAMQPRAIQSTALSSAQIDNLFNVYFLNYNHFLPILDPFQAPDEYYDKSELLFWVLISIAARKWDHVVSGVITKVVTDMAWVQVRSPPLSLYSVQALLLLTAYPATTMRLWTDSSMSFNNLAMTAALHMGLHRPNHTTDFYRRDKTLPSMPYKDTERTDRMATWAACNIVAQDQEINFGHNSLTNFGWATDRACEVGNEHTVPEPLRQHLIIQRFSNKIGQYFGGTRSDPLGLPSEGELHVLMNVFEQELDTIEAGFGDVSIIVSFYISMARLNLRMYWWLCTTTSNEVKVGLLRSYSSAMSLLNLYTAHAETRTSILAYSPITFTRSFLHAHYICYRITGSCLSNLVTPLDETVHSSLKRTLMNMSNAPDDLSCRAASIIQDLWSFSGLFAGESNEWPRIAIRSHLSASLTYDAGRRWKQLCTMVDKERKRGGEDPGNAGGTCSKLLPSSAKVGSRSLLEEREREREGTWEQPVMDFNWDDFPDLDWDWALNMPLV